MKYVAGLGMTVLLAGVPVAAQEPQPRAVWQVDGGASHCSLIRTVGGRSLVVRRIPGTGFVDIYAYDGGWRRPPVSRNTDVRLVIEPAGRRMGAQAHPVNATARNRAGLILREVKDDIVASLAGAERIAVLRGDRTLFELPLRRTQAALATFHECERLKMQEWGLDEAALSRLRSYPHFLPGEGLTDRDYPLSALRAGQIGDVVVMLTVSSAGLVSRCRVLDGSGVAALDERTCLSLGRLRLQPAIDVDGRPVEAVVTQRVSWRMSR